MMRIYYIRYFILAFLVWSCTTEPAPEMRVEIPLNFPPVNYDLNRNPVTTRGFELGRSLFYDGILSRDGTISCGNCHQQGAAFSHSGHKVSHGVDDKLGIRNAPTLMNLAWQKDFLWDGGVHDLDLQPIAPIQNPVEMDETLANVLTKLNSHSTYPDLFKRAFGNGDINTEKLMKALSQFMITLVSANSRYDKYVRGEGEKLSTDELEGLKIVQMKCSPCHGTELFTDLSFRDNGLDEVNRKDNGRYNITLRESDQFKFKVPSLRNVEVSAPYMHDGRFKTLEQVLTHYSNGIKQNANLDLLLKAGITLTSDEQKKIVLFLKTLTDEQFLKDSRFSETTK